ncbi:hypothetical protein D3C73_729980 [compost metagenome]
MSEPDCRRKRPHHACGTQGLGLAQPGAGFGRKPVARHIPRSFDRLRLDDRRSFDCRAADGGDRHQLCWHRPAPQTCHSRRTDILFGRRACCAVDGLYPQICRRRRFRSADFAYSRRNSLHLRPHRGDEGRPGGRGSRSIRIFDPQPCRSNGQCCARTGIVALGHRPGRGTGSFHAAAAWPWALFSGMAWRDDRPCRPRWPWPDRSPARPLSRSQQQLVAAEAARNRLCRRRPQPERHVPAVEHPQELVDRFAWPAFDQPHS